MSSNKNIYNSEQKKAEYALRISKERYALATSAAKVGVWDWNLKTNDFYLDPIIKAFLGYSDDEIPNDLEKWTDYIHPDDRQAVMDATTAHLDGLTPTYTYEHRMLHKDGSIRWMSVNGKAYRDKEGNPIRMLGTDTDITERKVAEITLDESRIQFEELFNSLQEGISIVDANEKIISCNPAFAKFLEENSVADVIGKSLFDYLPEEHREFVLSQTAKRKQNQSSKYEIDMLSSRGNKITMLVSVYPRFDYEGKYIGSMGTSIDISDRKRAENALRESEIWYRSLIELGITVYSVVDAGGKILYESPSIEPVFGYKPAELLGGNIFDRVHPDSKDHARQKVESLLKRPGVIDNFEILYRHCNGNILELEVCGINLLDNPVIKGVVLTTHDITERKRVERELQLVSKELESRVSTRTKQLAEANKELSLERETLQQKNIALKEILNQIEDEKKRIAIQIQANIDRISIPIIKHMEDRIQSKDKQFINVLRDSLKDITSPFLSKLESKSESLTPREIEICNMIKSGFTTKQIASSLNKSDQTVLKQRKMIRKKLGISNKKVNLATYLIKLD